MSRAIGYICDNCMGFFDEEKVVGVSTKEELFTDMNSYATIPNPSRAECHYCIPCYRREVLDAAASMINRRKDENAYGLKIRELSYGLRLQTVKRFRNRKKRS